LTLAETITTGGGLEIPKRTEDYFRTSLEGLRNGLQALGVEETRVSVGVLLVIERKMREGQILLMLGRSGLKGESPPTACYKFVGGAGMFGEGMVITRADLEIGNLEKIEEARIEGVPTNCLVKVGLRLLGKEGIGGGVVDIRRTAHQEAWEELGGEDLKKFAEQVRQGWNLTFSACPNIKVNLTSEPGIYVQDPQLSVRNGGVLSVRPLVFWGGELDLDSQGIIEGQAQEVRLGGGGLITNPFIWVDVDEMASLAQDPEMYDSYRGVLKMPNYYVENIVTESRANLEIADQLLGLVA